MMNPKIEEKKEKMLCKHKIETKLTELSLLPVTISVLPEVDTQVSRHRTMSV